jgi:Ca2+-transporting ATPase
LIKRQRNYPLASIPLRLQQFIQRHFITKDTEAYVTAIAMETELGHIAQMIQSQDSSTPLQIRLAAFGKRLSIVILIICTLIFMIGWLNGEAILSMLLTSISLAVAAIPKPCLHLLPLHLPWC